MSRDLINMMRGLIVAMVFGLAGCGGGSDQAPVVVNSTPTIASLRYSPASATLNQGGGAITVVGAYDFIDNGADLAGGSVTIKGYNQSGVLVANTNTPLTNITGQTSGTLSGPSTVSTTVAGTVSFVLFITDANGNKSNDLTGTFTVR